MIQTSSFDSLSSESDILHVECSSEEGSPVRNNKTIVLDSTELYGAQEGEVITISSVASPEPQIVNIESYSIVPKIPYEYGRQQAIILESQ